MVQSNFYKYLSLIKLIVGLIILFVDYVAINVFEDPFVAIGIFLVGSFFVAWGASFFFFLFFQKVFKNNKVIQNSPESESYKLSFLFGMYTLVNILLILIGSWNKLWGLLLLLGFIVLLYFLMMDSSKNVKKSE